MSATASAAVPGAEARLLEIDHGLWAAVGCAELVHLLVDRPMLHRVPRANPRCSFLFRWEQRVLPLMDLSSGARLSAQLRADEGGCVAIVAYLDPLDEVIRHGALALAGVPTLTQVSDADALALDALSPALAAISMACFGNAAGVAMPVLDLSRLYTQADDGI